VFKVLFLNAQNEIIAVEDLFEGTLTASSIYPREIFKEAIKHDAASLIFAHNHPTGNPNPSENDLEVTRDLVFAASMMQIDVLDHVIIGDNQHFSFADQGLIKESRLEYAQLKNIVEASP
jgi:DNA repair protein RadC